MALDPSVFNALGRVKSAADWQADFEDRDNKRAMLGIQQRGVELQQQSMAMDQQRNALALDAARRQAADDSALRSYMAGAPDLGTPEGQMGLYRASPSAAAGVLKTHNEGMKAQREAKAAETTQKLNEQKLSDAQWEARMKKHQQAILDISGMTNADEALANLQKHVQSGDIDFQKASMIAQNLQQTRGNDAAFRQWRSGMVTSLMDAKDRAMAERQAQNDAATNANRDLVLDQSTGRYVPNAPLIKAKTQIAAAGAPQVPGMTYMTDSQGNIVGLPTKAPMGTTVVANVVRDASGKALPGKDTNKPLPEGAQKQVVGARNLQDAVDNYLGQLATWSKTDMLSPDARRVMGNAYNNMMLQAKEAYNLGVLNGPDYEILQRVVADPTNWTSAIVSNDALGQQANELKRIAGGIERTVMESHGKTYAPRAGKPVAGPKPGDVDGGYRFKGGDPSNQANWEKVK